MSLKLKVIYLDSHLVVVVKPSGLEVHPVSRPGRTQRERSQKTAMKILRDQLGQKVFPVHRLDRATSGLLIFALSSESARMIQEMFQERKIAKEYLALVRGWPKEKTFKKEKTSPVEELTEFETLQTFEIPVVTQEKFKTSRYALVRCFPYTGRRHQIRRHLKSLGHPIIGDTIYGDGKQNRAFQSYVNKKGLYLRATALQFPHPVSGQVLNFSAPAHLFWEETIKAICRV